jgi:hypothetical protein
MLVQAHMMLPHQRLVLQTLVVVAVVGEMLLDTVLQQPEALVSLSSAISINEELNGSLCSAG